MTVLDGVLLVVLVAYALSGLRQGLVVAVLSVAGFVGGALAGMALLPELVAQWSPGWRRTLVTVVGVLLLAWAGQVLGSLLGRRVRSVVTWRPARALDSALGAVAAVVAVSLVVWFVAGAVRAGPLPSLARAVASSRVVEAIDRVVPPQAADLSAGFRSVVEAQDFPRVFRGTGRETIQPVAPPDAAVVAPAAAAAAGGTVKVTGLALECSAGREGSGFVVAPRRVVTNAHVVAGVHAPSVQVTGQGPLLPATVVVFDPARDLAVLAVPGLRAEPLGLGQDLEPSADAVVVGFPQDGPFTSVPARVRDVVRARGHDIHGQGEVEREVYSLAARVEPGNSGGPLLDAGGSVVGVVFARSLDDPQTGYALTLAEAAPVLQGAQEAAAPVDTGTCAAA
ncbi:MarP family serine protease [Quadrisphaera sp. DSM 44207]|uniref:MarP family serine protease n=1 Tax=Quadrisphaera sp. DSM 44207 TaxID=1881057 RepID=UPI000888AA90|nr:MarP family serine protease [Quadrisphaera sp. DSM 44207]SDQ17950.1 Colicin V production protein [Quadrisphaera sp. DSM 44207]